MSDGVTILLRTIQAEALRAAGQYELGSLAQLLGEENDPIG